MQADDAFVAVLERISALIRNLQWSAAYAEGLYPIQLQVLQLCAARQPTRCTPTVLAAELKVTVPSMSDTLAALERKELLRRQPHPTDRRGVTIELTEQGRQVLERVRSWDAPLRAALAELPIPQREVTYEMLLALLRQLYYAGVITMPRMCLTCRWLQHDPHRYRTPYHCSLLQIDLLPLQLRVECPDHQAAG